MKATFHWATHKNEAGQFEAIVRKDVSRATPNERGYYVDSTEVKRIPCKTRAIAKNHAIKWARYLRANPEAA